MFPDLGFVNFINGSDLHRLVLCRVHQGFCFPHLTFSFFKFFLLDEQEKKILENEKKCFMINLYRSYIRQNRNFKFKLDFIYIFF